MKFIKFDTYGIPCEVIENDIDLELFFKNNCPHYRVPDDYDFENFKSRFVLVDGKLKELSREDSIQYELYKAKSEELINVKKNLITEIDNRYNSCLLLTIENGFRFSVNLRDKNGTELLNIIKSSIGSYVDDIKGKKTQTFFITILEAGIERQIQCSCLNWLWQYIFEELLTYVVSMKQLKDNYILDINSIDDYNKIKTIKKTFDDNFIFPKKDGLKINVSKTISKLLDLIKDTNSLGQQITIPSYVKNAIINVNRELFRYVDNNNIILTTREILKNSWFE
jgi:hypothetical protein